MKTYQKVKIENCYNSENLEAIETFAELAIDYMVKQCEYVIDNTYLDDDGFLEISFVEGQDIDKQLVCEEMQEIFDEKFAGLLKEETEMLD